MSDHESLPAPRPALRIDDAARQTVSAALGRHLAEGRLDMLEYEERLEQTFAARTEVDLVGVLDDLPSLEAAATFVADQPSEAVAKRRATARTMIVSWLSLCAFFVVIWAMSDFGGYFWPIWPIMGTGLGAIPGAYAVWNGTASDEGDEDGENGRSRGRDRSSRRRRRS